MAPASLAIFTLASKASTPFSSRGYPDVQDDAHVVLLDARAEGLDGVGIVGCGPGAFGDAEAQAMKVPQEIEGRTASATPRAATGRRNSAALGRSQTAPATARVGSETGGRSAHVAQWAQRRLCGHSVESQQSGGRPGCR